MEGHVGLYREIVISVSYTHLHNQNLEARYVLRFDAFGSLDCVYKVNPTICDICVSEGDNIIYAVMIGKDGEYVLAKSQLKTILL